MRRALFVVPASLLFCAAAQAAEGMWTLDNLPRESLARDFGFEPSAALVDKLTRASARLAGGCSGSFVSSRGLVLTNNHCVVECTGGRSSAERDLVAEGFLARERAEELQCPGMEINRLEASSDVTARVGKATAGLEGKAYQDAKRAEKARIESECGSDDRLRCDVVELYGGGQYQLYRYRRFQDVRLVFAPEFDIGFFGGDPDNFQFPRFTFDVALLRVYDKGKPAKTADWFPLSTRGLAAGDLTLVTGHPGTTDRLRTVAQLERTRDVDLIGNLVRLAGTRGLLTRYSQEGEEAARHVQEDLPFLENSMKVYQGQLRALQSPALMERKRADEAALRASASPGDARVWDDIAAAQRTYADIRARHRALERGDGLATKYFDIARTLLRGAEERAKPNAERLREYQDARLPQLTQSLFSPAPIHAEYEALKLGWSLARLREAFGPDDAVVRALLGKDTPETVAQRLVAGTKLGEVQERRRLWEGGTAAVAESQDPFIALARQVDAESRAVRTRYETEVEAIETRGAETLARVRFARFGTGVYPDATFTLRLSYGRVEGWEEQGRQIGPFTTLGGLFERATGAPPFRLPPRWLARRDAVDPATPLNLVSSNDITGGNSGSPLLDRSAQVAGLVFDGNIHALGGAYGYDAALNRTVAVDARAIVEVLRGIYQADALVKELRGG